MSSITFISDGKLTDEEAISALRITAQEVDRLYFYLQDLCETKEDRQRLLFIRDIANNAYLNALGASIVHTSPLFEEIALSLVKEAELLEKSLESLASLSEKLDYYRSVADLALELTMAF